LTKEELEGLIFKEELTRMGHVISRKWRLSSFNFSLLENNKDELMELRGLLTKEGFSDATEAEIVGLEGMGRLRGK
jgi:hypothetical protein